MRLAGDLSFHLRDYEAQLSVGWGLGKCHMRTYNMNAKPMRRWLFNAQWDSREFNFLNSDMISSSEPWVLALWCKRSDACLHRLLLGTTATYHSWNAWKVTVIKYLSQSTQIGFDCPLRAMRLSATSSRSCNACRQTCFFYRSDSD